MSKERIIKAGNTSERPRIRRWKAFFCALLSVLMLSCVLAPLTTYAISEKKKAKIEKRAAEILSGMTLNEKIAQMLLVNMPLGTTDAKEAQQKRQYGGYLMFANAFQKSNPEKMLKRVNSVQKVSKVKMLIAVDEEGGTVVRASKYKQFRSAPYQSPRNVYKSGGFDKIKSDAASKSKFLLSLGINTNLAPVADVPYSYKDFIYSRAFSTGFKGTSYFVRFTVEQMNKKKCIGCLKHFPGYGNNGDTHTDMIVDKRSKDVFETRDLMPFKAGIKAGVPMIMVSHNIVRCFDKKNTASMSKTLISYLRKTMGYEGVIITDSLGMDGVREKYGSDEEVAVRAVKAGNDMLCTPYGFKSLYAIKQAVLNGEIKEPRIDKSVMRILKMKLLYGIME